VDSSPEPDTENELSDISEKVEMPFDLVYIRSPKGLTLQRNIGIDISTKPLLYFLDDDARPLDDYFAKVREVFLKDSTIAAVGGCAANEMDKPIPRRWRIRRTLRLVPRTEPFIYNDAGTSAPTGLLKPFSGIRDVDIFPGYAFAIRRSVCDSMRFSGFFDGYSYGEDVEMALRIRQKARVVSCGDARVIHRVSPGGRPPAFEKGRMEVRNRYFIWRRYSQNASLLNKLRFHLDFFFLFLMDVAWFVARPWRMHYLSHAFGVLSGTVSCALSTPKWTEEAPVPKYRLSDDFVREAACQ
jgi:GT2 family glycosyltransferase